MKRTIPVVGLALVLGASGLNGCAMYVRPAGVGVVYIQREPPPLRVEVRGPRPSPRHVWLGGHWIWRAEAFVWEPGRWELMESGHRGWVEGSWHHDRHGWYWADGHWR